MVHKLEGKGATEVIRVLTRASGSTTSSESQGEFSMVLFPWKLLSSQTPTCKKKKNYENIINGKIYNSK